MKSIVTRYTENSVFSGTPTTTAHHLIFGRGMRALADADLLIIPVTDAEHNMSPKGTINQIHGNPIAEKLSKMLGQVCYEKQWIIDHYGLPFEEVDEEAREAFRKRYGRSWL